MSTLPRDLRPLSISIPDSNGELIQSTLLPVESTHHENKEIIPTYENYKNCESLLGYHAAEKRNRCGVCRRKIPDQEECRTIYKDSFLGVICIHCNYDEYMAKLFRIIPIAEEFKGVLISAPMSRSSMHEMHIGTIGKEAQYSRTLSTWIYQVVFHKNGCEHYWSLDQIMEWNPDLYFQRTLAPVSISIKEKLIEGGVPNKVIPY